MWRFDYQKAHVLTTIKFDDARFGDLGEVTEDGKLLFTFANPGKSLSIPGFSIIHTDTGKVTWCNLPDTAVGREGGLVPGGQYFYLASPHVHIVDRATHSVVARNILEYVQILDLTFSGDGRKYAVLMQGTNGKRRSPPFVQVFPTLTSHPTVTFDTSNSACQLKMSTDGKRIAVMNRDSTIEVWTLEDVK